MSIRQSLYFRKLTLHRIINHTNAHLHTYNRIIYCNSHTQFMINGLPVRNIIIFPLRVEISVQQKLVSGRYIKY